MKRAALFLSGLAAPLLCLPAAHADDTDLYITPNTPISAQPLVMFTLDYLPQLTSTVCSDASSTSCTQAQYFRESEYEDVRAAINAIGSGKLQRNDMLRLALQQAFHSLEGQIKAGLMMSHKDGGGCAGPDAEGCTNGGYIISGFKTLGDDPSTEGVNEGVENAQAFLEVLKSIPDAKGSLSHDYQGAEMYFELFRYLTGQKVYNGLNGWESFNENNQNEDINLDEEFPAFAWDRSIMKFIEGNPDPIYLSPFAAADCSKIYVINIMTQNAQNDDDSQEAMEKPRSQGGLGINLPSNGTFEAVVEFMRENDLSNNSVATDQNLAGKQTVISYFVTENDNTKTRGYAEAGGTNEPVLYTEDPATLVVALEKVFKEILSVSTTFVAASVPVNVFNRSESLDNVYIALFQVDELARPFWHGNLKKLKLDTDASGAVFLRDVGGSAAISDTDGRIRYDALTYWTQAAALPPPENDLEVAGKDGRSVARGGAGQKIPGFLTGSPGAANSDPGARQLFYDPATFTNSAAGTALLPLNADSTTAAELQSALGASAATGGTLADPSAQTLIRYARGLDVRDADQDMNFTDARPWLLGDALHSRPLPINYGNLQNPDQPTDTPDIFIAMGAQDGFMHFFRNSDGSDPNSHDADGQEVWAFMPREVMDGIEVYYHNTDNKNHPYMVDGAPAAYLDDADNDGTIETPNQDGVYEKAILYFGLRRGGSAYYALDVSNPTAPPEILWRITRTSGGDFDELGQTWSMPSVGHVDIDGPTRTVGGITTGNLHERIPVVIFAGGYDTNKDRRDDPSTIDVNEGLGTDDDEGNAIYVVNALTGELVWKAVKGGSTTGSRVSDTVYQHPELTDSIPSDVTVVDTDGNGETDRILVGDTGGKVWRADIGGARSNWQLTLLGDFGSDTDPRQDRRFFHRPDFVQSRDGSGESNKFDAVIIGSGSRPNPFDRNAAGGYSTIVENWVFMIKDREIAPASSANTVSDTGFTIDSLMDVTDNCMQTGTTGTCTGGEKLVNGWKLKLAEGTGEKALSTPITLANTVYFSTYLPFGEDVDVIGDPTSGTDFDTCGPQEGEGLLYAVSLLDATATQNYNEYNDVTNEEGQTEQETLDSSDRNRGLASAGIPADVISINFGGRTSIVPSDLTPEDPGDANRWRTFWYNVEDNDNY